MRVDFSRYLLGTAACIQLLLILLGAGSEIEAPKKLGYVGMILRMSYISNPSMDRAISA